MSSTSRAPLLGIAIASTVVLGCSLTHDFEGLANGGGGASTTADASSGSTGDGASSSSGACVPTNTCASISPSFVGDDGCGVPLRCACDAGSVPDAATGQCVCSGATLASDAAHPTIASQINGHQPWSDAANITEGATGSATVLLADGQFSNHLQARGFDLGLPAGAKVRHIRASICERQTGSGVRDEHVRLLFGNQVDGQDAKRDQSWPTDGACVMRDYDWPVAPTTTPLDYDASVFAGSGFGIQLQITNSGPNDSTAHVAYVTLQVDYEPACTPHAI